LLAADKIAPRGVGVSLSGTPLLADASLRGARLSGTSLSGVQSYCWRMQRLNETLSQLRVPYLF
jgi:hypothetical protein